MTWYRVSPSPMHAYLHNKRQTQHFGFLIDWPLPQYFPNTNSYWLNQIDNTDLFSNNRFAFQNGNNIVFILFSWTKKNRRRLVWIFCYSADWHTNCHAYGVKLRVSKMVVTSGGAAKNLNLTRAWMGEMLGFESNYNYMYDYYLFYFIC